MKVKDWILFTAATLSLASGCNRESQPAAPATPAAIAGAQPLFTPQPASLAQQKMCDEQTGKKVKENQSDFFDKKNPPVTSYTSHYDPTENICYVRVDSLSVDKTGNSVSAVVYDAFGGRVYANYIWINSQGKKYWEVAPTECDISIPGKPEQQCKSDTEFDELTEQYFGVTK
jgi:hypothetical protein